MNAHTKPAKVHWVDIDARFDTLQKSVEILCWLGEEVEKNVALVKKTSLIGSCATFDDLAGEQAYVIKGMVAELRKLWGRHSEEAGL